MSTPAKKKLAVVVVTTLVIILGLEIGCRVLAHKRNGETLDSALSADLSGRRRIGLIDIIRPNANDQIVDELKPKLEAVMFKGAPVTTNRWGFRSADLSVEKSADTVTIVGIGDSLMFGHGVADGECYLDLLKGQLEETHPERNWRVLNAGVPGYNTVMEVETLREKCLKFDPDLVILELVGNDLELPIYMRIEEDVFDLTRSFALAFVREKNERSDLLRDPRLVHQKEALELEFIPERYRHLIGWENFDRALDELEALRDEHGFRLLVFHTLETPTLQLLAERAQKRGLDVVSLMPEVAEYMRVHYDVEEIDFEDTSVYGKSDLAVSPANLHPSALHHGMASKKIFEALLERGWLDELAAE